MQTKRKIKQMSEFQVNHINFINNFPVKSKKNSEFNIDSVSTVSTRKHFEEIGNHKYNISLKNFKFDESMEINSSNQTKSIITIKKKNIRTYSEDIVEDLKKSQIQNIIENGNGDTNNSNKGFFLDKNNRNANFSVYSSFLNYGLGETRNLNASESIVGLASYSLEKSPNMLRKIVFPDSSFAKSPNVKVESDSQVFSDLSLILNTCINKNTSDTSDNEEKEEEVTILNSNYISETEEYIEQYNCNKDTNTLLHTRKIYINSYKPINLEVYDKINK